MNLKIRFPSSSLLKAIYGALTTYQTTPVYRRVPPDAVMPYITIEAETCKPNGTKTELAYDMTRQIHIWSDADGELEACEISNDVGNVLTAVALDLSADHFNVVSQSIEFKETMEDDEYCVHAIVTFGAKIQDMGGV